MLYENLEVLKKKSLRVYNLFRKLQIDEYSLFNFEQQEKEIDIYANRKTEYIPQVKTTRSWSATMLVDEALSGQYDGIIVIGVGSNLFWEKLLDKVDPEVKMYIVEFGEVVDIIFRNTNIQKIDFNKMHSLTLIDETFDLQQLFSIVMKKTNMNFKIFVMPQYDRLFKDEIQEFYDVFKKVIDSKRRSMHTNMGYQKRWIFSSIINFKHVLSTSKFFDLSQHDFSKSVAIVVGAGPSLSMDIEYLKALSKDKKCYIFAVGSAYKALVNSGVHMDAIFSYDPSNLNADVLADYYEKEVDVPLCFGSSIAFESIRKVDYEKAFHMITSQDYFSTYLLEGKQSEIVLDAPSIAVIAIQALAKVGFKNIVFAGQNLAYLNEKNYADGIEYKRLEGVTYKSELTLKDVFGKDVFTTVGYKMTLNVLEQFVKANSQVNFINSTYGGAAIEGAEYKPLKDIEFDTFDDKKDLLSIRLDNPYDALKAKKRFEELRVERDLFVNLLDEGFKLIYKVKDGLDNDSLKNFELLSSLERVYNQMAKNMYFKVLISKLDRNYINIFESNVVEINREDDIKKKHELIYKKMGTLFSLFKRDDIDVNKLFEYILKYIVWE